MYILVYMDIYTCMPVVYGLLLLHTLVLTITGTEVLPPGLVCGGVQATLFSVILNTGHGAPPTVMS